MQETTTTRTPTPTATPAGAIAGVWAARLTAGGATVVYVPVNDAGDALVAPVGRDDATGVAIFDAVFGRWGCPTAPRARRVLAWRDDVWYGVDRAEVVAHAVQCMRARIDRARDDLALAERQLGALERLAAN